MLVSKKAAIGVGLSLALATSACGPGEDAGESSEDGGGACHMFNRSCEDSGVESFQCTLPVVCAQVVFEPSGEDAEDADIAIADIAVARCVLQGLRDDVVAHHNIAWEGVPGFSSESLELEAFGDGRVIARGGAVQDLSCTSWELFGMRQDDAFFDACLATGDSQKLSDCFRTAVNPAQCLPRSECPD